MTATPPGTGTSPSRPLAEPGTGPRPRWSRLRASVPALARRALASSRTGGSDEGATGIGGGTAAGRPRRLRRTGRHERRERRQGRLARPAPPPTLDDLLRTAGAAPEPGAPGAASTAEPAAPPSGGAGAAPAETPGSGQVTRFGNPGRPLNRGHPFYVGFVGATGVLVAIGLVETMSRLSQVITLLVVALFLALGLDPVVQWLHRSGLPRAAAIAAVFLGLLAIFAGFFATVIPVVVAQASELVSTAPEYLDRVQSSPTVQRLDREYGLVERLEEELGSRVTSGETMSFVFGGVLGAGRAVLSGTFGVLTVLVLTLYFLASLHPMKEAAYQLVPRSRRQRVRLLGDEVVRRIGGYVIGQLSIATLNGVASFVVMTVLEVPYAAVLALCVGVLGLIPLVGATIGAVLVVGVAMFTSFTSAAVLAVYYLAYQQLENYVLAPRVMARAVSVPGAVAVVAALAGGSLLGVLGALIAIPVAAGLLLVVQEVFMPRQQRL